MKIGTLENFPKISKFDETVPKCDVFLSLISFRDHTEKRIFGLHARYVEKLKMFIQNNAAGSCS